MFAASKPSKNVASPTEPRPLSPPPSPPVASASAAARSSPLAASASAAAPADGGGGDDDDDIGTIVSAIGSSAVVVAIQALLSSSSSLRRSIRSNVAPICRKTNSSTMHLQRGAPATTMRTGRSAGVETAAGATREGDCGGERWGAEMREDRVSILWTKRNDVGGGGSAPEPFEVGRAAANDEPLAASDENRQAHEIWLDVPLVDAAVTGGGHTFRTHIYINTRTYTHTNGARA